MAILKKIFITCCFLHLISGYCYAQSDSAFVVLGIKEFIQQIKNNHPLANQATLIVKNSNAELLSARGGFDPTLNLNNEQKDFAGKNYFNYNNAELVIPTWFGIKAFAGVENNSGEYINSEQTKGVSSYAGISLPILKDLIFDKRRATLQQAKIFNTQSEWDQKNAINILLFEATNTYSNWIKDYQVYKLFDSAYSINLKRYALMQILFTNGDKSSIDTTEALAQLQNFLLLKEEAKLKYLKQCLEISTYLWSANNQPIMLNANVIPDIKWQMEQFNSTITPLPELIHLVASHPKMKILECKIQSLETDRKLKFQNFLPQANLKYNFLQKGYEQNNFITNSLMERNYKFGFSFSMPLPNRLAIGNYKSAQYKIKNTQLEQALTQNNIENKVKYSYQEVLNLKMQILISQKALSNFTKLFEVEKLKFELGETTLFVLNTRELKAIESNQKLIELQNKLSIAITNLSFISGTINSVN